MKKIITQRENGSMRVRHVTEEDELSLTQQSDAEHADINKLLDKHIHPSYYEVYDMMDGRKDDTYGDISSMEFQEMQNIIAKGKESFASLSSKLRNRFSNSPVEFLKFLENPENREEAIKLKLIKKDTVVPPPEPAPEPAPEPPPE